MSVIKRITTDVDYSHSSGNEQSGNGTGGELRYVSEGL